MSKSKDNVTSLLAAIQRKAPSAPSVPETKPDAVKVVKAETAITRKRTSRPKPEQAKPKSRVGKPIQFWFHDEDRRLIRELAAWLAGQGLRPTDSMVVRAALRMAKTGSALLEAYHEEAKLDGRLKRGDTVDTE